MLAWLRRRRQVRTIVMCSEHGRMVNFPYPLPLCFVMQRMVENLRNNAHLVR